MTGWFQDVRYGFRMLLKNPGFTLVAVLTLALGVGANSAIFSVVNAVLLRPLPFSEPDRVVAVETMLAGTGPQAGMSESASYPDFVDWRSDAKSFAALASYRDSDFTLTGVGEPQHLPAEVVAADFFTVLGVQPALGRGFSRDEEKAGSRVVVLSHQLWQSRFGSDPSIVGRAITLDNRPYTVIGVTAPGFTFPFGSGPELWTTLALDAEVEDPGDKPVTVQRGAHFLSVVGRLRPGSTVAQANAEMNVITQKLAQQYPDTNKENPGARVRSELEDLVGKSRHALLVLLAAVGCVLLIGCVNVANLLLARATNRRREIAIRAALGGGRGRVMRQLLTESLLLSLLGGGLGLILALWSMPLLLRFAPDVPRMEQAGVDANVLGFTLALSVITGIVFGLVPALQATHSNLVETLKEGDRGGTSRGHRLRSGLVIAETAVGLVLLVGAGLLLRTFSHLMHTDPGFDPHNVLTLRFDLPDARYKTEQKVRFYDGLLERLNHLPGVQSAATTWTLPLSGSEARISFQIEGHPVPKSDEPSATIEVISPRYFEALHIPLLRGRAFNLHDTRTAPPVVIISESFARKYFPNEDPIGRRLQSGLSDSSAKAPWREVVGVVADIKQRRLSGEPLSEYYLPYSQAMISSYPLCVRTTGDPHAAVAAIRAELTDMDPEVPVHDIRTLDEYLSRSVGEQRFNSLLLGAFGGFALVLTMVGLYGVMAYSVAQHTRDIGVRMALGASRSHVLQMVLRRGFVLAGTGIAIGAIAAAISTRFISSLLYGVHPLDAATFAAVALLLAAVALLASYIPARRATKVDPMVALRYE